MVHEWIGEEVRDGTVEVAHFDTLLFLSPELSQGHEYLLDQACLQECFNRFTIILSWIFLSFILWAMYSNTKVGNYNAIHFMCRGFVGLSGRIKSEASRWCDEHMDKATWLSCYFCGRKAGLTTYLLCIYIAHILVLISHVYYFFFLDPILPYFFCFTALSLPHILPPGWKQEDPHPVAAKILCRRKHLRLITFKLFTYCTTSKQYGNQHDICVWNTFSQTSLKDILEFYIYRHLSQDHI